ncbi:MAG: zinc-ribbon domain-containing protein [Chloroflexi bacterium]|nr:zinc-ribbon domain-containing protein [Chloroflexota bacterium]
MISCPNCGTANPEVARFCMSCGTTLTGAAPGREARKVGTVALRHGCTCSWGRTTRRAGRPPKRAGSRPRTTP